MLTRYLRTYANLPARVWWLSAVLLVNRSGAMVMVFLTLYLTSRLNWSVAEAGQAMSTYGVGACVGSIVGGRLANRWGTFPIQAGSLLGTALGYLVLSVCESRLPILITIGLTSIAAESFRPANALAITVACQSSDASRAFALNRLAANLGFTFGPAIGGFLATISYQALFVVDAASCLLAMLVLVMASRSVSTTDHFKSTTGVREDDQPSISNVRFWCFAGLCGVMSIVFLQLLSTYPLYLHDHYLLRERQIGSLMAINTLVIVAVEMPLVASLKRYRSIDCVAVGALLICIGFGLLPLGNGIAWAILVVLTWTLGEMIAMPSILTFVALTAASEDRGRRLGAYGMVTSAGFMIAPLIGTWCYQQEPHLIWWISLAAGPLLLLGFRGVSHYPSVEIASSASR
ncbi:MAG: MFS transporter [Planctomycetota bacterium]